MSTDGAECGPQHVVPAHDARQRLDQRGAVQVDVIGQHDAPSRGGAHVVGCASGRRHAQRAEREAQVLPSAPAEPARAARQGWVDGDTVTDAYLAGFGTRSDDGARHLVTWHHRKHAMLAGEDVQVSAAEPDCRDLDDHVVRPGRRIVDRRDLDRARRCHHHGSHAMSVSHAGRGPPRSRAYITRRTDRDAARRSPRRTPRVGR